MPRNIFIAGAWPYVNGPLHLGHAAALLPGDLLMRYHRALGDEVLGVSGSDCHGTPILVAAEQENRPPEEVAAFYHREALRTLIEGLGLSYNLYSMTMGTFHHVSAQQLFQQIHAGGYLVSRQEDQLYCENCTRFLPDRYIEGTCPHCNAVRARGDQCDTCGHLLQPEELVQPRCRTCNSGPVWRDTTHLYFQLPAFETRLKDWVARAQGWRKMQSSKPEASWNRVSATAP